MLEKKRLTESYIEMSFEWLESSDKVLPGRFFTVRCSGGSDPLLRRPFAFSGYSAREGRASFIFQIRGRATKALAALDEGTELDILGPLGRGFSPGGPVGPRIIAAGGIGLGPMLFLARAAEEEGRDPLFLFGARSSDLVPREIAWPRKTFLCTEDGSEGFKGTPVSWLEANSLPASSEFAACGPLPFLKAFARFARSRGAPCELAVEQVMACGVGACMGCAVKLSGERGYARACTDGPVFDAEELSWD
jgi:dihydroorotate dehydrogenase electron transfer subunit